MNEINKRAIVFFKRVKSQFKKDSNGEINYQLFDKSSMKFKYICSKMPEFFVRSSSIFKIFDNLYYSKENKKDLPYDKFMFERILRDGFLDIETFEKDYPVIKSLAEDIIKRINEIKKDMWMNLHIIPQELQSEINKLPDVYKDIIENNGQFQNDNIKSLRGKIENCNEEDLEYLSFAFKVCKCYEGITSGEWIYNPEDDYDISYNERRITLDKEELERLKKRRDNVNSKLKTYGFFTTLFSPRKRKEKSDLVDELRNISTNIKNTKKYYDRECLKKTLNEYRKGIVEKYKEFYREAIRKNMVSKLKEDYKDSEHKELLDKLIDYLLSSKKDVYSIENLLSPFVSNTFDEYTVSFTNALRNIHGLSNAFLNFEELENKDLYSLLDIITKEIMSVPCDSEHSNVVNKYRDISLSGNNMFFANTPSPSEIPKSMESLNEKFKELLQIEDPSEYVQKVGILWYKFISIHPYIDGNGRIGRYLFNILLAHKGFIIPSLYNSSEEQFRFIDVLDNYGLNLENIDMVGVKILDKVRDVALDLSGKKRLTKKNSRQSDVWAVNKDPNDIDYALQTILERKNKLTKPLYFFTNCSSKFIIDGKEIERHIGSIIFSKEIDVSLGLMSNGNYGDVVDKTIGFLHDNGIPVQIVVGEDIDIKPVDNDIPETWFIREDYVLRESLKNSRDNGCDKCVIYPNAKSRLMVGYYTSDNKFHEVWGLHFKGIIATENSWSLLIDEHDNRNTNIEEAIKIIEEKGFSHSIGDNPYEEVKKK